MKLQAPGIGTAPTPKQDLLARLAGARTLSELGQRLAESAEAKADPASVAKAAKAALDQGPSGARPLFGEAGESSLKLFCGTATPEAVKAAAKDAGLAISPSELKQFGTGDVFSIVGDDVFNRDVLVIQGAEGGATGGAYDLPTLVTEALQIAYTARGDGALSTRLVLPKSLDPEAPGATAFARLVRELAKATGVEEVEYSAALDGPRAEALPARVVPLGPKVVDDKLAGREAGQLLAQVGAAQSLGELMAMTAKLDVTLKAQNGLDKAKAAELAEAGAAALGAKVQELVPSIPRVNAELADRRAVVFTGQSNPALAADIAEKMGAELGQGELVFRGRSPDFARLVTEVKDRDVVVVQTTRYSPQAAKESQNSVMGMFAEAMLLALAAKDGGAKSLTLVLPYMPSVRSDKKDQAGVAAYAAMVAAWIDHLGFGRVVLVEPHDVHIPAMFQKTPVQVISGARVLSEAAMREMSPAERERLVMVSPDQGANKRTKLLAKELGLHMVTGDKTRDGNDDKASVQSLGDKSDVDGKIALVTDDEIATGGTMRQTCERLKSMGAEQVIVAVAHANMPLEPEARWKAMRGLKDAGADRLMLLDTQPVGTIPEDLKDFVRVVSAAPSIAGRADRTPR